MSTQKYVRHKVPRLVTGTYKGAPEREGGGRRRCRGTPDGAGQGPTKPTQCRHSWCLGLPRRCSFCPHHLASFGLRLRLSAAKPPANLDSLFSLYACYLDAHCNHRYETTSSSTAAHSHPLSRPAFCPATSSGLPHQVINRPGRANLPGRSSPSTTNPIPSTLATLISGLPCCWGFLFGSFLLRGTATSLLFVRFAR